MASSTAAPTGPATLPGPPAAHHDHDHDPDHPRLSIATPSRLALGALSSALVGFSLGATQGGQMAQLRFRAEHAHKMPDTTAGWYFYHKSKNYRSMQGGIREGFRMGFKTGVWSLMALSLESTVDRLRGASDMFSTTIATLTVAGAFSIWRKLFYWFCLTLACTSRGISSPRFLCRSGNLISAKLQTWKSTAI